MTWCWFLEEPLKEIETLMGKFKKSGTLIGFKINNN